MILGQNASYQDTRAEPAIVKLEPDPKQKHTPTDPVTSVCLYFQIRKRRQNFK